MFSEEVMHTWDLEIKTASWRTSGTRVRPVVFLDLKSVLFS